MQRKDATCLTPRAWRVGDWAGRRRGNDMDLGVGNGPAIEGPGEMLTLGMAGRPTLDQLSGDGVDILRARLEAT